MGLHAVNGAPASVPTGITGPEKLAEVAVGATSGALIAANANRRKLILQNLHATQVAYLSLAGANGTAPDAVAAKGIAVAGGETLVLPFAGAVKVIASGASTPVRVQEL